MDGIKARLQTKSRRSKTRGPALPCYRDDSCYGLPLYTTKPLFYLRILSARTQETRICA
jgi:hypothetical protein